MLPYTIIACYFRHPASVTFAYKFVTPGYLITEVRVGKLIA